jgi:hypothetical protein
MDELFLAPEAVIELPLSSVGSLNDRVRPRHCLDYSDLGLGLCARLARWEKGSLSVVNSFRTLAEEI